MPFDDVERRPSWIRSQGLGVALSQLTALLLAGGSVVLSRSGVSPFALGDDIRFFFARPSLSHAWFYLLIAVVALWAINTTLCTFDHVVQRWRRGVRAAAAYGAAVFHFAFLLALAAHLAGGIASRDESPRVVTAQHGELADGRSARLVELVVVRGSAGEVEAATARLEVSRGGTAELITVAANRPHAEGGLTHWTFLVDWREASAEAPAAVVIRERFAPGVPLAAAAALAIAIGMFMLGRRWFCLRAGLAEPYNRATAARPVGGRYGAVRSTFVCRFHAGPGPSSRLDDGRRL